MAVRPQRSAKNPLRLVSSQTGSRPNSLRHDSGFLGVWLDGICLASQVEIVNEINRASRTQLRLEDDSQGGRQAIGATHVGTRTALRSFFSSCVFRVDCTLVVILFRSVRRRHVQDRPGRPSHAGGWSGPPGPLDPGKKIEAKKWVLSSFPCLYFGTAQVRIDPALDCLTVPASFLPSGKNATAGASAVAWASPTRTPNMPES